MNNAELSYFEELYKEFIDENGSLTYQLFDNKYHCFNDYVIIPVRGIEKSINIYQVSDIDITNPSGMVIGYLCPVSYPENEYVIAILNEVRLFSYFVDSLGSQQQSDRYSFMNNYVAIKSSEFFYYKTIMNTSEYWGGYTHEELNPSNTRTINDIKTNDNIKVPSANHKESIILAVHSTSSFERFLKYYHQVELLFDSLFIAKLKNINSSDLKDYSLIIKDFNHGKRSELDVFKYILKNYMVSHTDVIEKMKLVQNHLQIANDMFNLLGKDTNPLKSNDAWNVLIYLMSNNSFDASSCSITQTNNGSSAKLINQNNQDLFNDFVVNLCGYWIYRIRCCIAHNKIGEYIFSYDDESFISGFGEHLLLQIIRDLFSNPVLHADLNL